MGLEANQDVTIKSLQPDISDVPDVLVIPGLLEAYSLADEKVKEVRQLLIKVDDDKVCRCYF